MLIAMLRSFLPDDAKAHALNRLQSSDIGNGHLHLNAWLNAAQKHTA